MKTKFPKASDISFKPRKKTAKEKAAEKLSKQRKKKPIEVFSMYCHVGNSGATFKMVDEGYGPTLIVKTSAFGNLQSTQKIFLDKNAVIALGGLFTEASNFKYSQNYCIAACARESEHIGWQGKKVFRRYFEGQSLDEMDLEETEYDPKKDEIDVEAILAEVEAELENSPQGKDAILGTESCTPDNKKTKKSKKAKRK